MTSIARVAYPATKNISWVPIYTWCKKAALKMQRCYQRRCLRYWGGKLQWVLLPPFERGLSMIQQPHITPHTTDWSMPVIRIQQLYLFLRRYNIQFNCQVYFCWSPLKSCPSVDTIHYHIPFPPNKIRSKMWLLKHFIHLPWTHVCILTVVDCMYCMCSC